MDMQLSRNYLNDMQHPENWQIAQMGLNDQFGWVADRASANAG